MVEEKRIKKLAFFLQISCLIFKNLHSHKLVYCDYSKSTRLKKFFSFILLFMLHLLQLTLEVYCFCSVFVVSALCSSVCICLSTLLLSSCRSSPSFTALPVSSACLGVVAALLSDIPFISFLFLHELF